MTPAQILAVAPKCPPAWADALAAAMQGAGITTPARAAMFLAQWAHETAGFTRFVENLNYSGAGLLATWPGRFRNLEHAGLYHRQPERIANRVYADRMGNGPEASGDGWRYRGRGACMLTGRHNYREAQDGTGHKLLETPDLLLEPAIGAEVAAWYWTSHKLSELADRNEFDTISRRINGGKIGLEDRRRWLARLQDVQLTTGVSTNDRRNA